MDLSTVGAADGTLGTGHDDKAFNRFLLLATLIRRAGPGPGQMSLALAACGELDLPAVVFDIGRELLRRLGGGGSKSDTQIPGIGSTILTEVSEKSVSDSAEVSPLLLGEDGE